MLSEGYLVLYKSKPALVRAVGERLTIKVIGGEELKVREKDILALHPGPLKAFDPNAALNALGKGDFETARAMAEGQGLSPIELAELVYGQARAEGVWAVVHEALSEEGFFYLDGPLLRSRSEEEIARRRDRQRERDEGEARRADFVARVRESKTKASFEPKHGDERFMQEIEARALGKMESSKLMRDIGLEDSDVKAHSFLILSGKMEAWNPHPLRLGLNLRKPEYDLGPDCARQRRDLRHLKAFAIDNAWSNDPDDAIGMEGERLWVHVADPSAAVGPGSLADQDARARAATLYLPEICVPMLPDQALARYGLGLEAESPALSFGIDFDAEGQIRDVDFCPSIVRVTRLSYEAADALLDQEPLSRLDALARENEQRRRRNGAIDISIPEVKVEVQESRPRIFKIEPTRSQAVVREAMLLAGEAAARFAFREGIAFPYYGQEAPGEAKIPEGLAGEWAKRRLMRAGSLRESPVAHRGLGLSLYTQVTSPLRRYQDLLAHQQLCAYLEGRPLLERDDILERSAQAQLMASCCRQAERQSLLHWKLVWLRQNPEWRAIGQVVARNGKRATVFFADIGLESDMALDESLGLNAQAEFKLSGVDVARLESRFTLA